MRTLKTRKTMFKKEKQQKEIIVIRRNTLAIETILNIIKISLKS